MSFQKGHPFYKGGEKGWFKKGHIPSCKGTAKIIMSNCQWCKKEFNSPSWQKRKFCSCKCSGEFNKLNKVKIICKQCKKEFNVYPSEQDRIFCSLKCNSENLKIVMKGHKISEKTRQKLAEINKKEKHPQWKGGVTWDKEYWRKRKRDRYAKDSYFRIHTLASNNKRKSRGIITLEIMQRIYEDNIKKYGTLTCYLCNKPIEFKQDSLEHKMPLSRGGTNEYNNLAIAHRSCNCKKHNKTVEEYKILEVLNVS